MVGFFSSAESGFERRKMRAVGAERRIYIPRCARSKARRRSSSRGSTRGGGQRRRYDLRFARGLTRGGSAPSTIERTAPSRTVVTSFIPGCTVWIDAIGRPDSVLVML